MRRPHQWVKNLLVFVPLPTSRSFNEMFSLLGAICIFASFCSTASGVYLVNDLMDLGADRRHLRKRDRPFASGALPLSFGIVLACALVIAGIGLAFLVGATLLLLAYAVASLAYSLAFKTARRVHLGSSLYLAVSPRNIRTLWLLAFSGFTFLSLALLKRAGEMTDGAGSGTVQAVTRRGYFPEDRPILLMFGSASAFASSVVLALFAAVPLRSSNTRPPSCCGVSYR